MEKRSSIFCAEPEEKETESYMEKIFLRLMIFCLIMALFAFCSLLAFAEEPTCKQGDIRIKNYPYRERPVSGPK